MGNLQKTCIFFFFSNLMTFLLMSLVESCTCPASTQSFETNFCLSDYSYKGTIVDAVSDEEAGFVIYDVIVTEVYFGSEVVTAGSRIEVATSLSESECGVGGLLKGIYLFQGKGSAKEVSSCDIVKLFSEMSPVIRVGLVRGDFARTRAFFCDTIRPVTVRPEVTMEETTREYPSLDMEYNNY